MRSARLDDPAIDLRAHAAEVLAGRAALAADARRDMIEAIGIPPSPDASDAAIARNYLAAVRSEFTRGIK